MKHALLIAPTFLLGVLAQSVDLSLVQNECVKTYRMNSVNPDLATLIEDVWWHKPSALMNHDDLGLKIGTCEDLFDFLMTLNRLSNNRGTEKELTRSQSKLIEVRKVARDILCPDRPDMFSKNLCAVGNSKMTYEDMMTVSLEELMRAWRDDAKAESHYLSLVSSTDNPIDPLAMRYVGVTLPETLDNPSSYRYKTAQYVNDQVDVSDSFLVNWKYFDALWYYKIATMSHANVAKFMQHSIETLPKLVAARLVLEMQDRLDMLDDERALRVKEASNNESWWSWSEQWSRWLWKRVVLGGRYTGVCDEHTIDQLEDEVSKLTGSAVEVHSNDTIEIPEYFDVMNVMYTKIDNVKLKYQKCLPIDKYISTSHLNHPFATREDVYRENLRRLVHFGLEHLFCSHNIDEQNQSSCVEHSTIIRDEKGIQFTMHHLFTRDYVTARSNNTTSTIVQ